LGDNLISADVLDVALNGPRRWPAAQMCANVLGLEQRLGLGAGREDLADALEGVEVAGAHRPVRLTTAAGRA